MSRAMRALLGVVVVLGLVAGCTGGGQKLPGLTASPTAVVESPSPTPTVGLPVDRSDPKLGIVFEAVPAVTGDALTALDTLTLFEVEAWRAMTTGTVDPGLPIIATPGAISQLQAQLDGNAAGGWALSGDLRVKIDIKEADAHAASAVLCEDWTKVIATKGGVAQTPDKRETYRFDVPMTRLGDGAPWTVTYYNKAGTC